MRGRRLVPVLALVPLCLGLAPAAGKELPKAADQLLWCGSAYYRLSNDANDAGNDAEGDRYAGWSDSLMLLAVDAMKAAGFVESEIADAVDASDDAVVGELGTDKARYDIAACEPLVPFR